MKIYILDARAYEPARLCGYVCTYIYMCVGGEGAITEDFEPANNGFKDTRATRCVRVSHVEFEHRVCTTRGECRKVSSTIAL